MKNIRKFYLKNFILVIKFSVYFNRPVFVTKNKDELQQRTHLWTVCRITIRDGGGGLNRFYWCNISPFILTQPQITNICLFCIRILMELHSKIHMITNTVMKQSKWLSRDLKPEHMKTTTMMTIDIDTFYLYGQCRLLGPCLLSFSQTLNSFCQDCLKFNLSSIGHAVFE